MGDHFENVLLPRIKKIIYSKDWKDGKPEGREGISQLFRYVRLESYEDTLDGLELTPPDSAQQDFLAQNPAVAEDYRLRYALGTETKSNACLLGSDFSNPFAYTLSVVRDGVRHETPADLPETFNYLIGLRVQSRRRIDNVLAITGTDSQERQCLILWRNLEKTDAAKLEKWFAKHRKILGNDLNRIYVNGDHTLNAIKKSGDHWEAVTTEPVFRELMFAGAE